MISRKAFLKAIPAAAAAAAVLTPKAIAAARTKNGHTHLLGPDGECTHAHPHAVGMKMNHPEAREGITAADVIPSEQLREEGMPEEVIEHYDKIREMPELADAIACYCGCMLPPMNRRSLLTCYHHDGMARGCAICQGTARLVYGRFKEGQALERIRAAVDARYG